MLLFAICDDLQSDRLHIKRFIKNYCILKGYDVNIISFENGEALIKYYLSGKTAFDIIFLDIYMSGKNGILTAKQIRKYDSDCKIIFTTSSAEYALESFEVLPFNYLVKPISREVFDSVFEKAIKTLEKKKHKSITFKIGLNIQTISCKDIIFIESMAKKLNIHIVDNKSLEIISKLDDVESQINDKRFIRCHKSFLINMDYILSVSCYSFTLIDNTQIPITQRHFASIKNTFYDYILEKANLKNDPDRVD